MVHQSDSISESLSPFRRLYDFAIVPSMDERLDELAQIAEPEDWDYKSTPDSHKFPVLYYYLHYTFDRVEFQKKIVASPDDEHACWNTGLVTPYQEPIFALFDQNLKRADPNQPPWHFRKFCRIGEHELNYFNELPELASYFDDPSCLVFDPRLELRVNVSHIVQSHKTRFPEPYRSMTDYQVQTVLNGSIDNAKERVKRNYKSAVPQFYQGRVQLLFPICLSQPNVADLALVVQKIEDFYRASTCLTLDMAYNNARQLARPDRDWLQP